MSNLRVAALQMRSNECLKDNLEQAEVLIEQACQQQAELLLLPEYFYLMGFRDADKTSIAESLGDGPIQTFLAQIAQRKKVWLIAGTVPLTTEDPNKTTNSSLVYNPKGEQVARYDKIHLFCMHKGREAYNEAKTLKAGKQTTTFHLTTKHNQSWKIGLSICYDLRFPELYRKMNTDILMIPAAFTATTGSAHWEILLRARAIENQSYVVAAAQGGTHNNRRSTWGHSMIIDPWGKILSSLDQKAIGVTVTDLNASYLKQVRSQLPALRHRVLDDKRELLTS
jgi:nitrilase